jgi:hypothetical protein
LLGIAAVRALRTTGRLQRDLYLWVPPAIIFAASFFDATNPGVRRVLPALPFLLLFAAHSVHRAPRNGVALACVLLAGTGLEALRIHPHQLSYLNTLAGGSSRGPYVLDESNVDWGQDLPALADWQRSHQRPDEILTLYYFGSAEPSAYGVRAKRFDLADVADPPPGLYAISAHYLAYFRKLAALEGADSDWLARYQPVAKAGHSIWIYRLDEPGAPVSGGAPSRVPNTRASSSGLPSSR